MAAEPIGSAYVIIRALTSQLSKDIQDGLDKGAKDVDTDESGRELGERMGESTGDEFGETWTRRSSEEIERSADSSDMRRATDRFADRLNERFSDALEDDDEELTDTLRRRMESSIGEASDDADVDPFANLISERFAEAFDGDDEMTDVFSRRIETSIVNAVDDVDTEDAAGTLGEDFGDEAGTEFDHTWKRNVAHSVETTDEDDDVDRGMSGMVRRMGQRFRDLFRRDHDRDGGWFDFDWDLDFDFDFDPFRRMRDRFRRDRDSFKFDIDPFKKAAGNIQNVFSNIPGLNWLTILGLPALQLALPVLGALVGQVVGILGFLTTAALGGVVALAGVGAAIAPAALVLMSAFKVESPRLDQFNERLEEFMIAWDDIALATQDPLFTGLEGALDILQDSELITALTEYGEIIGGIAGRLASTAAGEITLAMPDIKTILGEGAGVFQTLGEALVLLIRPFMKIFAAAMPIARRFADSLKGAAERFSEFIDRTGTEGLTDTFNTWYDRLAQVGRILWNIGEAIWNVLNIGGDASVGLFDNFETFTQTWADWTGDEANRGKITGFFENAFAVAGELWGLIGDILALIFGPMTTTEGGEGMVGFIKSIREDWLPAIVDFAGALSNAISTVAGFAQTLWGFIEDVAAAFDQMFGTDIAEDLGPNLLKLAGGFGLVLVVLSKLKVLNPILRVFGMVLSPVTWALKAFAKAIFLVGKSFLLNPWVLAIAAIIAVLTLLYFHVKPFRDFVDTYIIDPLQRFWTALGGFSGALDLIKLAFTDFDAALDQFKGLPIISDLIGLFSGGVEADAFFDALGNAGEFLGEWVGDVIDKVVEFLPKLGKILGKALGKIFKVVLAGIVILVVAAFKLLGPAVLKIITNLPRLIMAALTGIWNFLVAFLQESGILEAVQKYFPIVRDYLIEFFKDLPGLIGEGLQTLGPIILSVSKKAWEYIKIGADYAWDHWIWPFLKVLPGRIGRGLQVLGSAIFAAAKKAWEYIKIGADYAWDHWIWPFVEALPGNIVDGLQALGSLLWWFAKEAWKKIKTAADYVWDNFIWPFVEALPGNIVDGLKMLGSLIWWAAKVAWQKIREAADYAWDNFIWPFVEALPGNIVDGIKILGSLIWWAAKEAWKKIKTAADYAWDNFIWPFLEALPGNIVDGISALGSLLWWAAKEAWQKIKEAADYAWDNFIWPFVEALPGRIVDGIKILGSLLWWAAKEAWQKIKEAADYAWDNFIWPFVESLPGRIVDGIAALGSLLWWAAKEAWKKIKEAADYVWDTYIWPFASGLPGKIGTAITETIGDITQSAIDLASGWWTAFVDWVEPKIQTFVDGLDVALGPFINLPDDIFTNEQSALDTIRGSMTHWATEGAKTFADEFSYFASGEFRDATFASDMVDPFIENFISDMGATGTDGAEVLRTSMRTALDDGVLTSAELDTVMADFEAAMGTAGTAGGERLSEKAGEAVGKAFTVGGGPGQSIRAVPSLLAGYFNTGAAGLTKDDFDTVSMASSMITSLVSSTETAAGDTSLFKPSADSMATNIADRVAEKDQAMVAPTNKLVDMILLTLSRIGNEVDRKVINPFILKMVAGINKASTESVRATNRLVDRVLLTLSRIGNETTRVMNPFILKLVDAINRGSVAAVAAANRLVNAVLLTLARIGNEASRIFAPFVNYLRSFDSIILAAIGDLSGLLVQKGKDLMAGLLKGVKSAITKINVPLTFETFAQGGFVPGTGPVPAIVHGGELILNAAQQQLLGSNVTRWANVAATALRMAGQSQVWMYDLLRQMKSESGGNPKAINRWDSNWLKGQPSMGLMQTILSTFNAFAGSLRSRGVYDPLANIFAAIMYTLRRYGNLGRWRRSGYTGYGEGGIFDRATLGVFGEAGREALIPLTNPQRAMDLMRMAGLDAMVMADAAKNVSSASVQNGFGPNVTDVAMLRIDHAEIFDKVDVDIIGARIRKAYTSMAGR